MKAKSGSQDLKAENFKLKNHSSTERIPLRQRVMDERRRKIQEFDEESKEIIEDHIRKQKMTQKLGLDFHIFEDSTSHVITSAQRKPQNGQKNSASTKSMISAQFGDTKSYRLRKGSDYKKGHDYSSPFRRKDLNSGSTLGMGAAQLALVQQIDAYRARKEPLPYGMSEEIWDLDSYRENFEKFYQYFPTVQAQYEDNLKKLRILQAKKNSRESKTGDNFYLEVDKKQEESKRTDALLSPQNTDLMQRNELARRFHPSKKETVRRSDTSQSNMPRQRSSYDVSAEPLQNQTTGFKSNKSIRTMSHQPLKNETAKKYQIPAYIPLKQREAGDLIQKMESMKRFKREMYLLHEHPNALEEITKGIRADQQNIAQTLQNNQLLVRILGKQRDRNQKWMTEFADEERKDSAEQRLPLIDPIDFDHYEETYEEINEVSYDYMKYYKTEDMTIKQIMEPYKNKQEKEMTPRTMRKVQHKFKPSRPMYISHYDKNEVDLIIFALLTEIKVIAMKQNGQKKTFITMTNYGLDDLPIAMDTGTCKITGNLLIIVACQQFRGNERKQEKKGSQQNSEDWNYIEIIEVDHHNGWACHKKHHIVPERPQISKIIFDDNYGLIIACYRGYVERYDNINFKSMMKWDNNLKPMGPSKKSNVPETFESVKKEQKQFERWILDELGKRGLATEGKDVIARFDSVVAEETNKDGLRKLGTIQKKSQKRNAVEKERKDKELMQQRMAQLRANALKALKPKTNEKQQVQTINCLDFSAELYLIAFGGVHGHICVLDSTTMSFIGKFNAHGHLEVSSIYFYKKEKQMISVSNEGDCALWDAQKMTLLQMVRNRDHLSKTKNISSTGFDQQSGTLLLATTDVLRLQLNDDQETKIQIDQQFSVAANYLEQMKAAVDQAGTFRNQNIKAVEAETKETKSSQNKNLEGKSTQNLEQLVRSKMQNNMQIVQDILDYKKLPKNISHKKQTSNKIKIFDQGSYSVLPSKCTRLIGCFVHTEAARMFTVDIDCLIRQWDLLTGKCVRSYIIEKPSKAQDQEQITNNLSHFKQSHQIQTVKLCPEKDVIAIAFMGGTVQINNIYSGAVLYNKAEENMLDLGPQEISNLAFFHKQTNFWVTATLWDGKVAFLKRPLKDQGGEVIHTMKVESKHNRDVVCIDITQYNHMATASLDHSIIFWNTYSGKESKIVQMPEELVAGNSISAIRFASRDSNDFLFVIMTNGDMFILETQSETFVEPPDFESNKIINPFSFKRIPKFAVIDLKQKESDTIDKSTNEIFVAAVDETGKDGCLFQITMSDPKLMLDTDRAAGVPRHVIERRFQHKKAFTINDINSKFFLKKVPQVQNSNSRVMKVELFTTLSFFIVCQANGVISFFKMHTGEQICYFNELTYSSTLFNIFNSSYQQAKAEKRYYNKMCRKIDNFTDSDSNDDDSQCLTTISNSEKNGIKNSQKRGWSAKVPGNGMNSNIRVGGLYSLNKTSQHVNQKKAIHPLTAKNQTKVLKLEKQSISNRDNMLIQQSSEGVESQLQKRQCSNYDSNMKKFSKESRIFSERTKTTNAMTSPNINSPTPGV